MATRSRSLLLVGILAALTVFGLGATSAQRKAIIIAVITTRMAMATALVTASRRGYYYGNAYNGGGYYGRPWGYSSGYSYPPGYGYSYGNSYYGPGFGFSTYGGFYR